MEKKVPIRTCIVCRKPLPKKELNRIVKSGEEIFMCVGAAHIVGEGAVAQNLKQKGYTIECITK